MQHEVLKYLYDIQESINSIHDYFGGKQNFDVYLENKLLRRGVERELEIIGEAINKILKIEPNIEITDSRRIVDLRN